MPDRFARVYTLRTLTHLVVDTHVNQVRMPKANTGKARKGVTRCKWTLKLRLDRENENQHTAPLLVLMTETKYNSSCSPNMNLSSNPSPSSLDAVATHSGDYPRHTDTQAGRNTTATTLCPCYQPWPPS